jgi:hypothetical protein
LAGIRAETRKFGGILPDLAILAKWLEILIKISKSRKKLEKLKKNLTGIPVKFI